MRRDLTLQLKHCVCKITMLALPVVALFGLQSFNNIEQVSDKLTPDEIKVVKTPQTTFTWKSTTVRTPGTITIKGRKSTKFRYSKSKQLKLENTSTSSSTTHPIHGEIVINRLKKIDKKGNDSRETIEYHFSIENQPHYISIDVLSNQVIKRAQKVEVNIENGSITSENALSTLFKVLINEINILTDNLGATPTNSGTSRYDDPSKYFILSEDQIQEIPSNTRPFIRLNTRSNNGKVIGMEITKNEILVDFAIKPSYDVFWWAMSQNACLLDPDTGIEYKIRGIDGGIPLEELLIVKGYDGVELYFTLIFPPLDPGVKRLVFMEKEFETLVRPSNAGRLFLDPNLKVKKLQRRKARY